MLLDLAASRRCLGQRKMSSVIVIVTDVLIQKAFQVTLIEDDHMVEQIPAAVADPALCNAILPRTSETSTLGLDAEALYSGNDLSAEVRTAIKDQIARRRFVRKCLPQLLNNPRAGRMLGHIAMKDATPVVRNDEEAEENAKSERRHGEEVHRGDGLTMITQKRRPSFCRLRISRRFSHPPQHGSLRKIEAKYPHFTVDARRTPGRVLGNHSED